MVMSSIEATVVASVLPTVTRDLGGFSLYRWIVSAYMLASAVVMPVLGRLSDTYGRRPVLFGSLLLFLLGSAASGAAGSMQELIVFRVVQGAGAGGLIVLAVTVLGDIYEPAERARVQGALGALGTAAGAAGPLVGALILRTANWRWAVYVNLPIGFVAWLLVKKTYVDSHQPHRHRFDVIGAVLLSLGIVGLLLSAGEHVDYAGVAASLALLAVFVWHERTVREPLMPLDLVRRAAVAFPCMADFARCGAVFALMTYLPLYAAVRSGASAVNAGLILTPVILGSFVGSSLGGRLAHRYTLKRISQAALLALAVASLGYAALVIWGGNRFLGTSALFVIGAAQGAGYLVLMLTVQVGVNRSDMGTANGVNTLAKYVGGALGVGLLGSFVVAADSAGSGAGGVGSLATPAMLLGFDRLFVAIGALALVSLLCTFWFPPGLRLGEEGAHAMGEGAM